MENIPATRNTGMEIDRNIERKEQKTI